MEPFTLLVFACLFGTDNCRPLPVYTFLNEKECRQVAEWVVIGWAVKHPEVKVERGLCINNPEYVIGRFQN